MESRVKNEENADIIPPCLGIVDVSALKLVSEKVFNIFVSLWSWWWSLFQRKTPGKRSCKGGEMQVTKRMGIHSGCGVLMEFGH